VVDGIDPLFGVDAVYCIADGCSLNVVVVLIDIIVQMVRWKVGWLTKLHESTEVFHGGSVSRVVHSLMYQDLDGLKLGLYLMISPRKDRERLAGCFRGHWCWLRVGSCWVGILFASKNTMVVGEKRGWYIGTCWTFVPEGMLHERLSTFQTVYHQSNPPMRMQLTG